MDINQLATETIRLQLAGINCYSKQKTVLSNDLTNTSINLVNDAAQNTSLVDSIAESVIKKLRISDITDSSSGGRESDNVEINNINRGRFNANNRNFRRGYRNFQGYRRGTTTNKNEMKCRSCQSSEHLVKDCPTRYCQACGNRGHDSWQESCPNYQ